MEELKYRFKGLGDCDSICSLKIDRAKNLVIASEVVENTGTSITNAAAQLATEICDKYSLNKERLIWIEHYFHKNYQGGKEEERYDLVTFMQYGRKLVAPKWSPLAKEKILDLINEKPL